jgi:hypothetical protein
LIKEGTAAVKARKVELKVEEAKAEEKNFN